MFSNGEVKGSTSTFNPSSKSWRRAVSASWLQATEVINEVVRKGACGHITVTWFVRFGNWVKTGRSDVDYEEDSGYWGTSILGILLLYFFPAFHDCLVLLSVPSCLTVQGVFHPCPPKQAALWHAERTVRFPPKKTLTILCAWSVITSPVFKELFWMHSRELDTLHFFSLFILEMLIFPACVRKSGLNRMFFTIPHNLAKAFVLSMKPLHLSLF